MALVKCHECGSDISTDSPKCPNCGATNKKHTSGCAKLFLAAVIGVPILFMFAAIGNSGSTNTEEPKPAIYNYADGSVYEVKYLLKKTLKDPKSYEPIEWSKVIQDEQTGYFYVRHKYRAKNSFGGYVVEEKIFIFDNEGKFETVTDL